MARNTRFKTGTEILASLGGSLLDLVWLGMIWYGLVWFGMFWSGLVLSLYMKIFQCYSTQKSFMVGGTSGYTLGTSGYVTLQL